MVLECHGSLALTEILELAVSWVIVKETSCAMTESLRYLYKIMSRQTLVQQAVHGL